ncbi:MAG: transglutaminaseTgpA domain-containing protein [Syntrophobacteraceae bacterium]
MVKIKDILKFITWLCVITGYASVFSYVNVYYSVSFAVLFTFSIYLDYRRTIVIPRWILNAASAAVLVFSFLHITTEYLVEPVLDALLILTAIKLLDERKFRDYMQIHMMCMFLLLGSSLISFSIIFLVYFLILITLSTASLVLLAYFSHDSEMVISKETLSSVVRQSLLICSIAIPASAIFFLILPRTNYPLLSFLNKLGPARTGFTDTVSLGAVSEIQEDANVIFRAEMIQIDDRMLYWRGIVLDRFDGTSWKSSGEYSKAYKMPDHGRAIHQTIYLEPYDNKYLFALDKPISITLDKATMFRRMHQLQIGANRKTRYEAISALSEVLPESEIDRERYLQLPSNFSPKIRELANSISYGGDEMETVRSIMRFLRQGNYKYSMDSLPVSEEPLEDFLFSQKRGNCEYFASSLAVMLRAAGVPARLVGGYKGGYFNRAGGYYMVLQSNAHVWVEAYSTTHGWVRIDPTPPLDSALTEYTAAFFMRLRVLADTFNYLWAKFVVSYDFSKQLLILRKIGSSFRQADFKFDRSLTEYKKYASALFAAVILAFLIYYLSRCVRTRHEKLMSRFLKRMDSYGYEKGCSEGLEEFVARIDREDLRDAALIFVTEFQKIYYKDLAFTNDDVKRLEASLKNL